MIFLNLGEKTKIFMKEFTEKFLKFFFSEKFLGEFSEEKKKHPRKVRGGTCRKTPKELPNKFLDKFIRTILKDFQNKLCGEFRMKKHF